MDASRRLGPVAASVLAGLLLASCASTKLKSSWKDPAFDGGPRKKLAVFVLARERATRDFCEDRLVRRLPAGTEGVAAHKILRDEELADRGKVQARLSELGFDGALALRLVTVDRAVEYVPPSPTLAAPYYGTFHGYYGYHRPAYYEPGRVDVRTSVLIESLLYAVSPEKLLWSGTSETVDPDSTLAVIDGVIELVVAHLEKERLVGPASPPDPARR